MERKSNMLLKVASIIMIVGGGLGIVFGIIAVLGLGALALALGSEASTGLLMAGALLALVSSIISLVAGIVGVKNAAVPEKAQTCIVFGIITAVSSVFASTLSMMGGNSFNFASLLVGLLLPVLYLVGAFQNKKLA